jgi:hypothetical protein
MTNEEILQKAIKKAQDNGYRYMGFAFDLGCEYKGFNLDQRILYRNENDLSKEATEVDCQSVFDVIFSHDFAKAFWGEEEIEYTESPFYHHVWGGDESKCTDKAWRVHLSQMVLEKEPLKYLEKFL